MAEGTNPEVYTEKHEKLLGDCETDWELYVDGYDEDGDLIYHPIKGEKCHQWPRYGYSEADCSFFICDCKVMKLGFKSVAHYLIKTRRSEGSIEVSGAENIVAQEIPKTTPDMTQKGQIRTRRALRS